MNTIFFMDSKANSIVIIESQPILLGVLSRTALLAGLNILTEVTDSKKALETALELTPGLILFSISVPSLNDLEQVTILRQHLPETRILALVTGEFQGQEQAALDHGAHKVLTKGVNHWELIDTLRSM